MRNPFIITILLFFVVSCCKEPIIEENSLCGIWRFESVDSLEYLPYLDTMYPWGEDHTTPGSFNFSCDSTGKLLTSYEGLTGGFENFIWSHSTVNSIIDLSFANGTTFASIEKHSNHSMTFWLKKYNIPYDDIHTFYKLNLFKE